jgi:mono/diheme cytochrome c family protein
MKKIILFVIAGMILKFGFVIWNIRGIEASEYSHGKDIYENKCQICHGSKGDGDGPVAAAFHPKPTNFTSPKFWEQENVDKIITDTIEKGHGVMPPISLNPNQIRAVIDYMSHTFKPGR